MATIIGRNLRRLRDERGFSQYTLADASGVSRQTIAHIELGQTIPRVDTLQELAATLHVDIHDLLIGREMKQGPIRSLVESFLASPYAKLAKITDDEIEWLRSLPSIDWMGAAPTEQTIYQLLITYRSARDSQ